MCDFSLIFDLYFATYTSEIHFYAHVSLNYSLIEFYSNARLHGLISIEFFEYS